VKSPSPFTLAVTLDFHQLRPCILTDIIISVHPIEASSVAPPTRGHLHPSHANGSSLYAHSLPPYWVIPVVTESIIPLLPHVYVTPSSTAPVPPPPPPPPSTQTPAHDHRSGTQKRTQKEKDLIQLEQEIISSPWYAANDLEPPCGSPSCPYSADCYGVRGMSCYTAFVIAQPVGTFGCWHCPAYSTRKLEDAVKHQRSNHFNHKPFLCTPTNGTVW